MSTTALVETRASDVESRNLLEQARDIFLLLRPKTFAAGLALPLTGYFAARPNPTVKATLIDLLALFIGYTICGWGGTALINSAIDQDTKAVNGLDRPPMPPRGSFTISILLHIGSVVVFSAYSASAAYCAAFMAFASIAYSHGFGLRRWKEIPILDAVLNGVGFGGATIWLGYAMRRTDLNLDIACALIAFSVTSAVSYVYMQVWQLEPGETVTTGRNTASFLGVRKTIVAGLVALPIAVAILTVPVFTGAWSHTRIALFVLYGAIVVSSLVGIARWAARPYENARRRCEIFYIHMIAARIIWIISAMA